MVCPLSSKLSQQALAGWMIAAVDLQMAVETPAIIAPIAQGRIDRSAGLVGVFCLKAACMSHIGVTSLAQIRRSGV